MISPSNEYSGLISIRMDWLDLLAVQGTLKSFLQHHSSKASILQCSAFLITSWKTDEETMATVRDFISFGSKITAVVNAAMKLKDTCSLEEKL